MQSAVTYINFVSPYPFWKISPFNLLLFNSFAPDDHFPFMQSLKTCSWTSTLLKVFFSSLLWLMNLNKHLVYWGSVIVYQWCVTWNSSDKWRNDRLRTFCRAILNIWHVFLEDNDAVFVSRENINSMVYWIRWRSFRALFYITSPEAKVNLIGQTSPFCLERLGN